MILGVLSATRDVLIILWALFSVIALLLFIFATLSIYSGVRGVIKTVKTTVDEEVKPILSITQDSATNVAGTTRFLGDTVAKPVIQGLSFIAGARRAISVFTGMAGRGKTG